MAHERTTLQPRRHAVVFHRVDFRVAAQGAVVTAAGTLDEPAAAALAVVLDRAARPGRPVVLDLSEVEAAGGAPVAAVVSAVEGHRAVVVAPGRVGLMLRLAASPGRLELADSRAEALARACQ